MSTQGDTHRRSRHRWRRTSSTVATGAVVAGLLVLSPGQADAAGTTYTVDDSGAAGCSDTPATGQPFCSINAAYKAAAAGAAGATITVEPGTYNERVDVARDGIILDAPAGATVDGTGTNQLLYGFNITGANVTVDGFTFTNQATAGVNVNGAKSTVIRNVTATGSATNGIRVVSGSNVTISQVTAKNNARAGILLAGATNSTVSSAETFGNQREGVSIQGGSGDVVENVTTHDNANTVINPKTNLPDRLAPGINVTNWVPAAGAAAVPATDITVQRNVSYGNDDSGIQVYGGSQGITVRRNLTYGNGDHGIDISQASTGVNVVSNTVIGNFTAGINIESNSDGSAGSQASVRNNIAVDNGNGSRTRGDIRVDGPSTTTGTTIDYDLVYDSANGPVIQWGNQPADLTTGAPGSAILYSNVADLTAATGQEAHGVNRDPKLDGNNAPGAGSPAIDAADVTAPGWTADDLNGNSPVDDPTVNDTGHGTPSYADLGALEQTNVPKPPTARLTATPSTVTAGGTVTLDASGSTDADGKVTSYAFDCGATGVTAAATGSTATCSYPTAGGYTAKVTVTDDQGASANATAPITVNPASPGGGGGGGGGGSVNTPPTAQLTVLPATAVEGAPVTLDASGSKDSDGSIVSYAFDCGDASTATVNKATATCTYAKAGAYTATVTVTDDQGSTAKASAAVTVSTASLQAPTAALTGGRVHRGQRIRIDASGSRGNGGASIVAYLFRCAGRSIGPKPGPRAVCVFRKVGMHRVRVRVTDSHGLTDWASAWVRVTPSRRPVARLSLSDYRIRAGGSVLAFAGRSHGFPGAFLKDVRFTCGNGQRSGWRTLRTYRCSYLRPGTYTVTVVVRNTYGRTDTASRVVRVSRG